MDALGVPLLLSSATMSVIRAAGFSPRHARIAVASATFVNSRRLKPAAQIVVKLVKRDNRLLTGTNMNYEDPSATLQDLSTRIVAIRDSL